MSPTLGDGTGPCAVRDAGSVSGPGPDHDEEQRRQRLLDAQAQAEALFAAIEEHEIIRPGVPDRQASDAVRDLAADMFGVRKHWHKRVVRSGPHTLLPYRANPRIAR